MLVGPRKLYNQICSNLGNVRTRERIRNLERPKMCNRKGTFSGNKNSYIFPPFWRGVGEDVKLYFRITFTHFHKKWETIWKNSRTEVWQAVNDYLKKLVRAKTYYARRTPQFNFWAIFNLFSPLHTPHSICRAHDDLNHGLRLKSCLDNAFERPQPLSPPQKK